MSGSGAGFEWGSGADYLLACSLDCWQLGGRLARWKQNRSGLFFLELVYCAGGSLFPAAVLSFENYS